MRLNKRIIRFLKDFGFNRVPKEWGLYRNGNIFVDVEEDGKLIFYTPISKLHDETLLEIDTHNCLKTFKSQLLKILFSKWVSNVT